MMIQMCIIVPKEDGFKDKNSMEGGKHLIWKQILGHD